METYLDPPAQEEENSNPKSPSAPASLGSHSSRTTVPYKIPPWSDPPGQPYFLEVIKDGVTIEKLNVYEKGAYMFGRIDLCDFVLEHQTISRFHAVLQFKSDGEALLYDLGSTHGTFVNKNQVKEKVYVELHVGDVIRFGLSSRLYIFQGPSELMPPEHDLKQITSAKLHQEMLDQEASLMRAKVEASLAEGISWGMAEDAIEEATEDWVDEVTWQTYKGQFTERQEKTREKILKRMEKVSNMRKEIQAIRAKDISQGGLTQGQQTQIARNEQRISQIMDELESLEETLNESIQESIGARTGKTRHGSKKANAEEEDFLSDDDDFYDRTKKRPTAQKVNGQPMVETADSLLEKKEILMKEMEEKKALLAQEMEKAVPGFESNMGGDDLDLYMTRLSSQLVMNRTAEIQKDLLNLQLELDRITFLMKIADPTGDATRKKNLKAQSTKPSDRTGNSSSRGGELQSIKSFAGPAKAVPEVGEQPHFERSETENVLKEPVAAYVPSKPQWLGATGEMVQKDEKAEEPNKDASESDSFVDYSERNKLIEQKQHPKDSQELELAGPGLIIRKRKSREQEKLSGAEDLEAPSSGPETSVVDAVALLLKHKKGYYGLDDAEWTSKEDRGAAGAEGSQPKRVIGPSRPGFLDGSGSGGVDYEAWVPPEGQTGDGRTSLNERLGY